MDYLAGFGDFAGIQLVTVGIIISTFFLSICLLGLVLIFWKNNKNHPRLFTLIVMGFFLSLIEIFSPDLPILKKVFHHSFHAFYIFVILLSLMVLSKEFELRQLRPKIALAFILLFLVSFLAYPSVLSQYFEPPPRRLSTLEVEGERIDWAKIELLLGKIPKDARFELFPPINDAAAFAGIKYGLSSTNSFVYLFMPEIEKISLQFSQYDENCGNFYELLEKTGTQYLISTTGMGRQYLLSCGLIPFDYDRITLFTYKKPNGIIENGKLLDYKDQQVVFLAQAPQALVKINFFPRWKAYSGQEILEIENAKPGMLIKTTAEKIIVLKQELTTVDYAGILITVLSFVVLFIFYSSKSGKYEIG
ncbi:MAG: hypothetical protein Q7K34_00200 [archaeon]|nr:hypothetical protein [archaeon]